nr:NADH dehydrogenase subunit 2 [Paravarcia sp.]
MKLNLTKLTMMIFIIMSTTMMMSSNNIFYSWMSMEINMISFLPLLTKSKKMSDQPMKYFIIQSVASSMMLMSILINSMIETPINLSNMLMISMLMKMGMMPFHLWMVNTMQSMTWTNCMLLSTLQKIAPTMIISQTMTIMMTIMPTMLSMFMAPIAAMNQTSTKSIMAYSSISNSPWMIMSMMMSKQMFLMFFFMYSMLTIMTMKKMKESNIMFINQMTSKSMKKKINLIILILSMSGMPPMLGFLPKWMILEKMMLSSMLIPMMMILSSMTSTFIYMKMISMMVMMSKMTKKTNKEKMEKNFELWINMLGLPMMMILKL